MSFFTCVRHSCKFKISNEGERKTYRERESTIMLLFLKDPYLFRFQIPFSHADVCEEFKVQLNILFSDSVQSKFQMTTFTSTYLLVFPPRKMCFVLLGDKLTRRKPSIN